MTSLGIYAEQIRRLGSMTTAERARALRDLTERVRALWAHLGQVHGGHLRKALAAHLASVPSQGETRTTIPRRLSGVVLVKWAEAKDRDQSWLDAVVAALPAQDGDEARRQIGAIEAAREAFVTHNLALVVFFASRAETGMELPDRIQAGNPLNRRRNASRYTLTARHSLRSVNITWEGQLASLHAGGSVKCGDVHGHVAAGTSVDALDVAGDITAGTSVKCRDTKGNITAGTSAERRRQVP